MLIFHKKNTRCMYIMPTVCCPTACMLSFVYNIAATSCRVCHCNGEWGQVYCHPSLQLVEELVWKQYTDNLGQVYILHLCIYSLKHL